MSAYLSKQDRKVWKSVSCFPSRLPPLDWKSVFKKAAVQIFILKPSWVSNVYIVPRISTSWYGLGLQNLLGTPSSFFIHENCGDDMWWFPMLSSTFGQSPNHFHQSCIQLNLYSSLTNFSKSAVEVFGWQECRMQGLIQETCGHFLCKLYCPYHDLIATHVYPEICQNAKKNLLNPI